MKRTALILVFLCILPAFALAQAEKKSSPTAPTKAEQAVMKFEQERVEALTQGDLAKLEPLLADDLTYTHSSGRVDSKEQFLESLKNGSVKYESMTHSNVKVALYGNTAVMRGESELKLISGGRPVAFRIRFLNVYVKKAGRWQLSAWQSTRLP